ncbi:MAG: hydrogenase maturation nickel metallochaperone HypA [Crenarchaeota archaeon]|nr:hydrogenase maturation nickel metallochaperone HypA [Thermoproteota archaeon]
MHEVSIAMSILSVVEEAFRETPGAKRVSKIKLQIGMLSMVDPEALRFALRTVSRGTPAEGAEIEIEMVKPVFRCNRCGHTWEVSDEDIERISSDPEASTLIHIYPDVVARYLRCPRCGSSDIEIVRGKGVIVHSVDIET